MRILSAALVLAGLAALAASVESLSQDECVIKNFHDLHATCMKAKVKSQSRAECVSSLNELAIFCTSKPNGPKNFGPLVSANRFWEGLTLASDSLKAGRQAAVMEYLYGSSQM